MKKTVTILIYDDIETLDFAGPFEVFSLTNEREEYRLFDIKVVAKDNKAVNFHNGLSVNPDCSIREITESDFLIIPGGDDLNPVLEDSEIIEWVTQISKNADHVLSICSGSLILAKAGLLEGLQATTHEVDFDQLTELAPNTDIIRGVRFTDNGKVISSAGISTGIDMSLHVIEKLYGADIANGTANSMEFVRR